jgi:branched-chain amino acid transport system substrate-binding protein
MAGKSDSNPTAAPVRIGIAVALSGRYALLGRQVLAGLECYVEDANAGGGMLIPGLNDRRLVELIVRDDESDIAICAQAVGHLIEVERIDLLMGPYGSGLTLAAARVAESRGVVLWNHSGSTEQIFHSGFSMVVGIISPASNYLTSILELVRTRDPNARTIALVSAETGFAEDVALGVERWGTNAGFDLIDHYRYPSGLEDFCLILEQLAENRPDCLLGVGRVEDDLQLARDLVDMDIPVKAVGLVVAAIDEFHTALGTEVEGFMAPSQWEQSAGYAADCGPTAAEFVVKYRARSTQPLDYPAAQGYVGGLIAQQCVEMVGTLEPNALRDAANRLNCTTFYGAFNIDPASGRQIGHKMLVTQWQGGSKQVVWPPTVAATQPTYPGPLWRARKSQ